MSILDDKYIQFCKASSNMNQLLPKIKEVITGYKHITEFGVRGGRSTWTLLSTRPKKLISYDIQKINVSALENAAKAENITFIFHRQNTCEIEIEETEVLFIDSFHAYRQLKTELFLHHSKVKHLILFHDTTTFGMKDENDSLGLNNNTKYIEYSKEKHGLQPAIDEFLSDHKNWMKFYETTINNGLTILKRN